MVGRYDRRIEGERVQRVHQEDFCQALAVPPERKYEADGGPTLADCFGVVRHASSAPARDVIALLDASTLNLLIGNHDAHAKNLSLLCKPDGARLAPLYDLISTAVYPGLARKLAMKLGGEYRPDYLRSRHLARFAEEAGLGPAAVRRRMRRWATLVPDVAQNVAHDLAKEGGREPVIDRVLDLVRERGRQLEAALAPPRGG